MTPSVPSGIDQSMRARPLEVVSPETPALAIVTSIPFSFRAFSRRAGKASSGGELVAGHQAVAEADEADGLGASRRR